MLDGPQAGEVQAQFECGVEAEVVGVGKKAQQSALPAGESGQQADRFDQVGLAQGQVYVALAGIGGPPSPIRIWPSRASMKTGIFWWPYAAAAFISTKISE